MLLSYYLSASFIYSIKNKRSGITIQLAVQIIYHVFNTVVVLENKKSSGIFVSILVLKQTVPQSKNGYKSPTINQQLLVDRALYYLYLDITHLYNTNYISLTSQKFVSTRG